jgi:hypothetical protein
MPTPPTDRPPPEQAADEPRPRAITPRMLAVLQKVEAARAAHLAGLRASGERDAERARVQKAAKKARAEVARKAADDKRAKPKKNPPIKKPPRGAT